MRHSLLLAIAILAACQPTTPVAAPSPASVTEPSPTPSSTPSAPPSAPRFAAPQSVGAVPEAGVLFVVGPDQALYRYDGVGGSLAAIPGLPELPLLRQTPEGAYVLGRSGVEFLRWDGTLAAIGACGDTGRTVDVGAAGECAWAASDGVWVRFPEEKRARLVLPRDWGAVGLAWSPEGRDLALLRHTPGPTQQERLHNALWLMRTDGSLRRVYEPPAGGFVRTMKWSPDGTRILVHLGHISNSIMADGMPLLLVHVANGVAVELGPTLRADWAQWSADGRLALVRGAGRATWTSKEIVVRETDGRERIVKAPTDEPRVALAPSWDDAQGRLAWVSGPAKQDLNGAGYVDGTGPGDRVAVIDDGVLPYDVRCQGERVVEGVRWAADGRDLLLLCRKKGNLPQPLELWLHRLDGRAFPLVTGLGESAFGYYGAQPSLFSLVAWSRLAR